MFTVRLNPCSYPPCGAGRVEVFSQSTLPGYPEGYFSRKLHTRRLLPTHVPVGYRQQNAGFYIAVKQSKQLFKRLHVALIDMMHREKFLQYCRFQKSFEFSKDVQKSAK